ncbi:MAG TPA: ADP-ribosylation factor-like protein [Fibrobacteraceae bacterium]|nr:ADP-ribosylation factor-like protein [Fibrobacteraceae bacterium]
MSSINFATREISCKIVYYGPGLSGKTTNLQVIHQKIPREKKTEMVSLATEGDRTLFFDFLPLNLGDIKGFKTKFQLYTVPGQVYYNSTRKVVLRGVDGVVFVADSQRSRMAENLESLQNLDQNLQEYGLSLNDMPFVFQYNKRDMENIFSLEELNAQLNPRSVAWYPATAHNGKGVVTTLKAIAMMVIENFNLKQGILRRAAESAGNQGVHDVTFSGEKVNIAPTAPESPASKEASNRLFQQPTSNSPMPDFDEVMEDALKMPGIKFPSTEKGAGSSPFQAPKIPSNDPKPRLGVDIPLNFRIPEEEIELRPYIPKKKNPE